MPKRGEINNFVPCMRRNPVIITVIAVCVWLISLSACHTTRHVPEGRMLLDHVDIEVTNDSTSTDKVKPSELSNYLRQKPNHRVLGLWPLRLMTYDLSGRDSTHWWNKWLRRLGHPPVIYSQQATSQSASQLRLAMINRGYMGATVHVDTATHSGDKKIDVTYHVNTGKAHRVNKIKYEFADSAIAGLIRADSTNFTLNPGDKLDRNLLDAERTRLTNLIQDHGYYAFLKDYINFTADTAANDLGVDLTMAVKAPPGDTRHNVYRIRSIIYEPDYNPVRQTPILCDTIRYLDISVIYDAAAGAPYIKPKMLWDNTFLEPGSIYSAKQVTRTYEALARLGIVKSVSIEMVPAHISHDDGTRWLDAVIRLTRNSLQGITAELEGTNSEGDLGFGVGLTYRHRNIFHGSELLSIKARGSYESLSGNLEGLINNRYTEAGAEIAITLPKFRAPFLRRSFRRTVLASTEFALNFNYQERPEYTRVIAGTGWKYKWDSRDNNTRRIFDLIDISYVYLPRSTINFLDDIAPSNPLLRYSYEDHFIMRMGFSFYKTNKTAPSLMSLPGQPRKPRRNIYTLRASVESAGNLLYAISSAIGQSKHENAYKIFGIQYAQYMKGEIDYMRAHNFDNRSSLAFHAGFGIGVPYGNSSMMPFEKRFYAGGANGVRGWGVRTLGPGRYNSHNSVTDFINQCGDIRIDLNLEYRIKLFWVFEGAAFIDAGNIWTIRNYENQPNGIFRFDSFYKELAWAYGLGIRLDFDYFLLRFDLGMKAYNPAIGQECWPLFHPNWHRDATFHFSVGYPF